MLNQTFTSRRFFKKFTIQLQKSGVSIIKTSPFESIEFEVPYDQLETNKTVQTQVSFGLLALWLFFIITGTLFLFLGDQPEGSKVFFILSLIVLCIALTTRLKVITIKSYDGNNIELFFTNKNKQEVLEFADSIINSTNAFLLNKFSKIDKDLPIDNQLVNLDFLRTKELITDEIFEQLKDQLLGRENKKSIGYR